MSLKFIDCFWETDFNGTLGFDLLCKKIKDGQKVCKDIEDFLKKRAKVDLQYSKALRNLVRSADGREETGDLGLSWQEFKNQTDKAAGFHELSAYEYNKLADDLALFTDGVKLEAKQIEDRVKDKQKQKRNAHNKLQECQKSYIEKSRDMLVQESQLDAAKSTVTVTNKETEKLKVKAEKSREAQEKADTIYKQSVDVLEQTRVAWETDMEDSCQIYQRQEEERIYRLRDIIWKCTNIDSKMCVDWDESCESVRKYLENCDVDRDIRVFVEQYMTGTARPVRIEYESYFEDRREKQTPSPNSNQKRPAHPTHALPPLPPFRVRPPSKEGEYHYTSVYSYSK